MIHNEKSAMMLPLVGENMFTGIHLLEVSR